MVVTMVDDFTNKEKKSKMTVVNKRFLVDDNKIMIQMTVIKDEGAETKDCSWVMERN